MDSILDQLPAEEIPTPRTKGKRPGVNFLVTKYKTCARCGAQFYLPRGAKGYTRSICGEVLTFCSWKCLREDEEKRERPKAGRKPKSDKAGALKEKNAQDAALLETITDRKRRKQILNRMSKRRMAMKQYEK